MPTYMHAVLNMHYAKKKKRENLSIRVDKRVKTFNEKFNIFQAHLNQRLDRVSKHKVLTQWFI